MLLDKSRLANLRAKYVQGGRSKLAVNEHASLRMAARIVEACNGIETHSGDVSSRRFVGLGWMSRYFTHTGRGA